jgi:serine/threonine protein kinase
MTERDTPAINSSKKEVLLGTAPPTAEEVLFTVDFYQVIKSIGKGGMGEVFLAYDPNYGRYLAIKRIRSDLIENKAIFNRFIKEARITSQLTHPAIIPIYAIRDEAEMAYYTMPYVEGDTLKQILIRTKKQQQQGEELDHIGGSIPALMRIFLNVCQAVAYAHTKRVLHRDLKPENIIIGRFGEVFMLDWGLAQLIHSAPEELDLPFTGKSETHSERPSR